MSPKQVARKLDALKNKQAKLRDELRQLVHEVEDHFDNAQEAVESLESAVDAVSRLV